MNRNIRRIIPILGVAALMLTMLIPYTAAAARRGDPPPPPPQPHEIDGICLERHGPGLAGWKELGTCNLPYAEIVFDGAPVEGYFLTDPSPSHSLKILGYGGLNADTYPTNSVPVILTGDATVPVCIATNATIRAPNNPDCTVPAII